MIVALRVGAFKGLNLARTELAAVYKDWSESHGDKILLTTGARLDAEIRPRIKQLLLVINSEKALLVGVHAVGPGWPVSQTPVPEGYSPVPFFESRKANTWLALNGVLEEVNPADFVLVSDTAVRVPEMSSRPSRFYVQPA